MHTLQSKDGDKLFGSLDARGCRSPRSGDLNAKSLASVAQCKSELLSGEKWKGPRVDRGTLHQFITAEYGGDQPKTAQYDAPVCIGQSYEPSLAVRIGEGLVGGPEQLRFLPNGDVVLVMSEERQSPDEQHVDILIENLIRLGNFMDRDPRAVRGLLRRALEALGMR